MLYKREFKANRESMRKHEILYLCVVHKFLCSNLKKRTSFDDNFRFHQCIVWIELRINEKSLVGIVRIWESITFFAWKWQTTTIMTKMSSITFLRVSLSDIKFQIKIFVIFQFDVNWKILNLLLLWLKQEILVKF